MSDDTLTGGQATRARLMDAERRIAALEARMVVALDSLDKQSRIMSALSEQTNRLVLLVTEALRYLFAKVGPPPEAEDPASPDHTSG